ncbi:hypothetical protein JHK82_038957 [Glycine max]|uniref:Uncharacterized protein n=1 Tax=Glycine max TaxID=3847 RepID=I1M803_SOYBN|nr:uncharacterized protein LOC100781579 [Glycine max]KAG4953337.1 hypothetical protein JHK87_038931 [Glycine soja]KAG5109734.1 hypothetical protein JHK82_038957 [Glycine max]KAH1211915.1 hypothetical protein GmHk_14G040242 [Glycine max]KRH15021.1 hypothetical protein GLYMA_14G063900v4 [Glycine max]|eukprot:XP_003544147.1 uncharacterized protein LOC100781579 [Glycine max]
MDDAELDAAFGFPSEFPYEFDSVGAEPADSGSTGTECSDEEDFFAGLTRRLSHTSLNETRKEQQKLNVPICNSDKTENQKMMARGLAGSPQSILSGIGSWSGRSGGSGDGSPNGSSRVASPTTTPFEGSNDALDVLYAAAGQVARLKMNDEVSSKFDFQSRGVLGGLPPPVAAENAFFANQGVSQVRYQQVRTEQVLKQQCGSVWGRQEKANWATQQHHQPQVQNRVRDLREFGYDYEAVKCTHVLPHSAWHPLQVKNQNTQQVPYFGSGSRPGLQGGSGVTKRGCAGTGVFLPRQYGAPPPESRKQTAAPVLVPAKVIHALNLKIDDLNSQPRFLGAFDVDYDALLARRNALLLQQKLSMLREEAANYEALSLPQEWTY